MIHSMSGGVLSANENLIYCYVEIKDGAEAGVKRWFISPNALIAVGDRVVVSCGISTACGVVLRIENVTAQTAPYPVKRTQEILSIVDNF